ncbi:hypothetical protein EON65_32265, partial [archaeon]
VMGEGADEVSVDPNASVLIYSFRPPTPSSAAELTLRAGGMVSDPPQSVSQVRFSPAGGLLLVSSITTLRGLSLPEITTGDPHLYPWEDIQRALVIAKGKSGGGGGAGFVFDKHSSAILQFDCTIDEMYLQSVDRGGDLLFYDLTKQRQEPSASKLADYNGALGGEDEVGRQWASQTCVFGWAVQGIWPPHSYDSTEINAVDRDARCKLLATAEDSGQIRVLRYPSVVPNSQSVVLTGHSSHVTNVKWANGGQLISVGGNDKCVFVWDLHEK